jgi:hypothetical protein
MRFAFGDLQRGVVQVFGADVLFSTRTCWDEVNFLIQTGYFRSMTLCCTFDTRFHCHRTGLSHGFSDILSEDSVTEFLYGLPVSRIVLSYEARFFN